MVTPIEYRPFLVQKLATGSVVRNSLDWNIYIKHVPFKPVGDLKPPYVKSWPDQNGNDVFYPTTPVFEAYDMECEFAYIGDENTATPMTKLFIYYLAQNGMFKLFDTFTQIGKTNVNYKSQSADLYYNHDSNIATFKLVFTVNDPVTDVTLIDGTT